MRSVSVGIVLIFLCAVGVVSRLTPVHDDHGSRGNAIDAQNSFASSVIDLTAQTFDEVVNSTALVLVKYYSPWCGHCRRMKPAYETAARDLSQLVDTNELKIAQINCETQGRFCKAHNIRAYPTLRVFKYGELQQPYEGTRQAHGSSAWKLGIVDYMMRERELLLKEKNPDIVVSPRYAQQAKLTANNEQEA